MKVAYSSDNSVKAVLLKDKTAKAESASKPQQYIEVSQSSRQTDGVLYCMTLSYAICLCGTRALH